MAKNQKVKEPELKIPKDEAQLAKEEFKTLINYPGWKRIVKYYKEKIDFYKDLLVDGDIKSLDELERIRDKIRLCEQFVGLPDLLSTFIDITKGQDVTFDPFFTPEEIVAQRQAKKS